ncbi:nitroreductase family protein [Candidatus Caldatribacterium saccharofermentans]|uniref:nitroreductase family protein n=1 Tax=Candidatus Caldatribacterium saccharofermentans TaxID=1454753 RepID=UPI003CFC31DB
MESFLEDAVMETIRTRRSVRAYSPKKVEEEKIRAILEAAVFAPSARNGQPWFFTVIENEGLLEEMNEATKSIMLSSGDEFLESRARREDFHVFHHAKTVILVLGKEDHPSAPVDCAAATENMLLAAKSLGVASCWIGFVELLFSSPEGEVYRRLLQIPEGYRPLWAVALGYALDCLGEAPPRNRNVVAWIR